MGNWMTSLVGADVEVASIQSDYLVLRHAGQTRAFHIHSRSRAPRLSELARPATPDAILVTPSLTPSAETRLRRLGWSWVTDAGQLHLRFDDHVVDMAVPPKTWQRTPRPKQLGVRGTGTFAVLRRLLLQRRWRQVELAAATGVTQARVSQILKLLKDEGIAIRDGDGWGVADWNRGLETWLSSYPGPRGVTTYWSGLDDVWTNTLTALGGLPDEAVVSGDVAADLLAPWRQPRVATIYVPAMDSLARTGLVAVTAPDDGTVAVCVPADRSVWPIEPIERTFRDRTLHVADPLQVLVDVAHETDADSPAEAERLIGWIKNEYAVGNRYG